MVGERTGSSADDSMEEIKQFLSLDNSVNVRHSQSYVKSQKKIVVAVLESNWIT